MTTNVQPMDLTTCLQDLGFSEYEARAYAALVRGETLNGYEVAKASGIPRANVYAVLEKLVQRGATRRLETRDGLRYAALPPARLLERLETQHQQSLAKARRALASLAQPAEATPVFNLRGHDELIEQAQAAIEAARATLLIAVQPPEAAAFSEVLRAARARGVVITTLCMQGCATECGGCQGEVHRYCLAPGQGARWLMLVVDDSHMIAGEIQTSDALAVDTEQRLIVELATSYIRQSVALATMVGELGERFHGLLSQQARTILDALHPEGGFLAYFKQITRETAV